MIGWYLLDEEKRPVRTTDMFAADALLADVERCRVARTENPVSGVASVSTVFLVLDHAFGDGPPLLFETMIFGGENDLWCHRSSTWQEAADVHEAVVKALRASMPLAELDAAADIDD